MAFTEVLYPMTKVTGITTHLHNKQSSQGIELVRER